MSSPTTTADAHGARFRRVLAYIDGHVNGDLTVDRLSGVAAFSKYHFHRQFSALFGISVYKYVTLVRLKRASYQLAFRESSRIIDIALASGYDSGEAFARAFKKTFGQTPTAFRGQPDWDAWHEIYQSLRDRMSPHTKQRTPHADEVNVEVFEKTRVAALEHCGDPRLLGSSLRRFIEWRKQHRLPPRVSATFNLLYDDPAETPPEDYRFVLCAATNRGVPDNPFGVVEKTIPGGRCAVLRHVGSDHGLEEAVTYLYSTWLPGSREQVREFPLYLQRVRFFPDVPEREAVTDIFLPLR